MRPTEHDGEIQLLHQFQHLARLVVLRIVEVDQRVLPPGSALLVQLSDQVSKVENDDAAVGVGLGNGNVALAKVIKCQDDTDTWLPKSLSPAVARFWGLPFCTTEVFHA